jgi:hypothetical protein
MSKKGVREIAAFLIAAAAFSTRAPADPRESDPVGLSLFFRDGSIPPLLLERGHRRYLQELDIVANVSTPTDEGIAPLTKSGDLARVDWRGISFVEEDWRQAPDGTFTRQRFYRGARWMNESSEFILWATDARGRTLGPPIVASAGRDDRGGPEGDFFVRRFVARQIASGCAAIGDCSTATSFTAQGLVQLREALHTTERARTISGKAVRLALFWSADPSANRPVDIQDSECDAHPAPGHGFSVDIEPVSAPANGAYYMPGETASFRIRFRDGAGHPLFREGSLPSYADYLAGLITPGLRYVDLGLNPTLYYALKKRESNLLVTLSGPTDRLKVPKRTVQFGEFFAPQVNSALTSLDGFSAVVVGVPPLGITFGGTVDPTLWQTPVSDVVSFIIPEDALPGTYVVAAKARRDFAGEALNRSHTLSIQVGTAIPTGFSPSTGPCTTCHAGPSALGTILHGLDDRRACFSCHTPLSFEPDNALDFRVHFVHSRSRRFPGDVNDCSLCHLTPPHGPARGFPGVP